MQASLATPLSALIVIIMFVYFELSDATTAYEYISVGLVIYGLFVAMPPCSSL